MFRMLHDMNFTYDSSLPAMENSPPFWPYTLDYKMNHNCVIPPCATKSFPGKVISRAPIPIFSEQVPNSMGGGDQYCLLLKVFGKYHWFIGLDRMAKDVPWLTAAPIQLNRSQWKTFWWTILIAIINPTGNHFPCLATSISQVDLYEVGNHP